MVPELTDRQVEIIKLLARGFTHQKIGETLDISPRTAKAHCDVLRHKLKVEKGREIPAAYFEQTGVSPWPG